MQDVVLSFNTSTLNLAEKRTAETRSKLSPIMNDPKKLDVQVSMTHILQKLILTTYDFDTMGLYPMKSKKQQNIV